MRIRSLMISVVAAGLVAGAIACSKSEAPPPPPAKPAAPPPQAAAPPPAPLAPVPFRVVTVDLGKAVGTDKKVAQPTTTFATTDTIYASIVSEGAAPSVALTARWTYEDGQLVNESSQAIAPTGPSATEFHIAKPSGWPTGKYKVEISANGAVVSTKDFVVD
ncbi:MAG TPA: hypothetical protein VMS22_09430 [Candidatus Eisenbacteria bacterium]|nr:hypothetical protein [Candidatus Eisenbacteria bacterium]